MEARALAIAAPDLAPDVLDLALAALGCAREPALRATRYLAVIDYSLPSTRKRFWLFDRSGGTLALRSLVAHGSGTGENEAVRFSNRHGTRQSSLGLFRAAEPYRGRNGASLRLDGLDAGINDQARARTIVLHGAWYVNEEFAARHGRLGRSWGCPAVEPRFVARIIEALAHGGALFVHGADPLWLRGERSRDCVRAVLDGVQRSEPEDLRR